MLAVALFHEKHRQRCLPPVPVVPAGATPWMGKMSKDISVTFDTEGVYVYECTPHKVMAMVGVIKVGNANNLDDIKQKSNAYKRSFVMNKDRLDKYLSEL